MQTKSATLQSRHGRHRRLQLVRSNLFVAHLLQSLLVALVNHTMENNHYALVEVLLNKHLPYVEALEGQDMQWDHQY